MKFSIFTLFPEMFPGPFSHSLASSAQKNNFYNIETINLRDYASDARKTVDDIPYGGGSGMVLKPDVIFDAVSKNITEKTVVIYPSPRGEVFSQNTAVELSKETELAFLCGRYEGIDQRALDALNVREISIGDYVLFGGEIPTMVMIEAIIRNIEGVIGDKNSLQEESFGNSDKFRYLLEYPHYTRPKIWNGVSVPEVLTSGNHKNIDDWRYNQSIELTKQVRPDVYEKFKKLQKEGSKIKS